LGDKEPFFLFFFFINNSRGYLGVKEPFLETFKRNTEYSSAPSIFVYKSALNPWKFRFTKALTTKSAHFSSRLDSGEEEFGNLDSSGPIIYRARLVQLHEQLHERLHNFNSQTANSLPNSLASFSENSLSQS
jgi:hypothetical protein